MKRFVCRFLFIVVFVCASNALAAKTTKILNELEFVYPPAEWHRGLDSPSEPIDPLMVKSYAVILKGGIPAERAEFYIGWEDYDYRGASIEGDEIKTRRGSIYTFLRPGDVMAVVNIDHMGKRLYMKLISADVYIPENRSGEKRHSRVTVMLEFKLPKDVYNNDDAEKALELVSDWIKPFRDIDDAKAFGAGLAKQNNDQEMTNGKAQMKEDEPETKKKEVKKSSPKSRTPLRRDR